MTKPPDPVEAPPPLGRWPRLYALVALVAAVLIALLYWFSATWNVPLGGR